MKLRNKKIKNLLIKTKVGLFLFRFLILQKGPSPVCEIWVVVVFVTGGKLSQILLRRRCNKSNLVWFSLTDPKINQIWFSYLRKTGLKE